MCRSVSVRGRALQWRGAPGKEGRQAVLRSLPPLLILLQVLVSAFPWAASAGSAPFREASLEELLRHNPATGRPVDSIEELVPLLPRELRENFTFVYDSRSPFRSSISPGHPRVILFAKDARLVLTFTGDERRPGFDLLESMSFDDASARFELHSFVLPAAQRSGSRLSPEASNCASCHGSDSRPIFDSYPLWPGFYGSVLDTFPHDRIGVNEKKRYLTFLAGAAKTGPYRELIFPTGSPVSPYLDPRRFHNNAAELDPKVVPFLPNARLGMALTEMNRSRIYRKLTEGKNFSVNEKRLLAELLECGPDDRPTRRAITLIEDQVTRENAERLTRLGARPTDSDRSLDDMQELQFIRELAEIDQVAMQAGADRSDWSMALAPGSLAFFDGILSGIHHGRSYYLKEDLIFELLAHLRQREPAFRRYFVTESVFDDLGYPFGNRIDLGEALKSCRLLSRR